MWFIYDSTLRNPVAGGVNDVVKALINGFSELAEGRIGLFSHTAVARFLFRIKIFSNRFVCEFLGAPFVEDADGYIFPNYYYPLLSARREKKSVVIVHDLQHKYYPENFTFFKKIWLNICFRRLLGFKGVVCFISEATKTDFFNNYGTPPRWQVIYNPVSIVPGVDVGVNKADFGRFLLASYHYYPHKNIVAVIRLFGSLKKAGLVDTLVVTGNGEDKVRSLVSELLDDDLINSVFHVGFVSKDFLHYLYSNCAAFVSLSFFEGFNLAAAEAAVLGAPLILSDIPVHRELFKDVANFIPADYVDCDLKKIREDFFCRRNVEWPLIDTCAPSTVARKYSMVLE